MFLLPRMYLLLGALFGILYALITIGGSILGIGNVYAYGVLAVVLLGIQFVIGPHIVEWSMHVQYVTEKQEPELHHMIAELAKKANLPLPRIGISENPVPNAFAFGRTKGDSRVCVTRGILTLLTKEELAAVLGHELSHIRHRDVAIITLMSVIPTIAWHLAWSSFYSRNRRSGDAAVLGLFAFVVYFLTNILVLYGSRIREYAADRGSIELGQEPAALASALYKLAYGAARSPQERVQQLNGVKAFFISDPAKGRQDFSELKALDTDMSGSIDKKELRELRSKHIRVSVSESMFELFSTHPNMLKRIGQLSQYTTT